MSLLLAAGGCAYLTLVAWVASGGAWPMYQPSADAGLAMVVFGVMTFGFLLALGMVMRRGAGR